MKKYYPTVKFYLQSEEIKKDAMNVSLISHTIDVNDDTFVVEVDIVDKHGGDVGSLSGKTLDRLARRWLLLHKPDIFLQRLEREFDTMQGKARREKCRLIVSLK